MSLKTKTFQPYRTKLYAQFARIGKAVANPRRLEILDLLAQSERTVENLAAEVGTTVSNISQHLQVLRNAGLVISRKDGLFVYCALTGDGVADFWLAMRHLAVGVSSELRELLATYMDDRNELEQIGQEELLERARNGRITMIDVRPMREFNAGHIPQSVSIPHDELAGRMKELPPSSTIVAYCRGPFCLLSVEAVEMLRAAGFDARRLAIGLPEWRAAGGQIEKSVP